MAEGTELMTSSMTSHDVNESGGESGDDVRVIVGLSVAGGVLLLVALVLLTVLVCRACRRRSVRMRGIDVVVANYAWQQPTADDNTHGTFTYTIAPVYL